MAYYGMHIAPCIAAYIQEHVHSMGNCIIWGLICGMTWCRHFAVYCMVWHIAPLGVIYFIPIMYQIIVYYFLQCRIL